jgi:hypothetical protein
MGMMLMSMMSRRLARLLAVAGTVVCFTLAPVFAMETSADQSVASEPATGEPSPPAMIEGLDHAEWTARWWQWAYTFPDGLEPYRDPDGRFCREGQHGSVWFLAGTDGSFDARRTCRIPKDRYLLVPVINMIHLGAVSGQKARPCSRLRKDAAFNNDHLKSAVVLLDGKALDTSRIQRLRTSRCFDPFSATGDDDSGMHAAADGFWLLLSPLPPGRHVLSIGANYQAPGDAAFGTMVQNFEYTLDIGEPVI